MALPYSFANNTSPNTGQLDADFLAVGAMGITACTATGTAAITLAQNPNQPAVSLYVNNGLFSFAAVNSASSSVTVAVNALSPLPLYLPTGVQVTSTTSGTFYIIAYLSALNSGAGGFQIVSALPSVSVTPVSPASAAGLLVKNDSSTPSTKIDITAQTAVLVNASGNPVYVTAPNVVIDLTTTGANGMDVGSRPTSGWVYNYLISTGSVTAGLSTATSPTAGNPTLPGGYSYFLYVGAMWCDGSQNLFRSRQAGRELSWTVTSATNTANLPILGSAAAGSVTAPTWVSISVTCVVPLTASHIIVEAMMNASASSGSAIIVAPNANYGGRDSPTNPPPLSCVQTGNGSGAQGRIPLETSSIFWAASFNSTNGALAAVGFVDYYVKA